MSEHTTKGNVFDDLGFSKAESKNLKIRSSLMKSLEKYIADKNLKQKEAAEALGISQPRVSDLLNGKIAKFSIDQLIKMHERIHIEVSRGCFVAIHFSSFLGL